MTATPACLHRPRGSNQRNGTAKRPARGPALGGGTLILEQDDSLLAWDRRQLYRLARPLVGDVQYRHSRAADELLLCVPDAIAWCWAKGGDWRRRIVPLVEAVEPV